MNIARLKDVFDEMVNTHPNFKYKENEFAKWLDDTFDIYLIPANESFTAETVFLRSDMNGNFKYAGMEGDLYFDGGLVETWYDEILKINYHYVWSKS